MIKKLNDFIISFYKWCFHSKISRKILVFFFISLLLSILMTYFLYQYVSRDYTLSNMELSSRQTLTSISSNIEEMVESADSNYNLLLKVGFSQMLKRPMTTDARKYVDTYLFTLIDTYKNLDSIYVTDLDGYMYGFGKYGAKSMGIFSVKQADWYEQAMKAKGSYLLAFNGGNLFTQNFKENFISSIRVINDLETQKPIGISIINLSVRTVEDLLEKIFYETGSFASLLDEKGNIICSAGNFDQQFLTAQLLNQLDATHTYVSEVEGNQVRAALYMPKYGLTLWASIPPVQDSSLTSTLVRMTILILATNILLMLIFSILIAKSITGPITSLIHAMKRAERGKFDPVEVLYPQSEIGTLELNYNHMLNEIQSLMDRLVQEQKQKRIIALKALQEQIKPHFLYNTLDAIGYMALTAKPEITYDAIETLGSFYRQSLSNSRQMITLGQEVQIVKDYIQLLSLRYENLFTVSYEIEESLTSLEILKLILQPLVENSVYHGIKPLGEPGKITIQIYKEHQNCNLQVLDNGVGMDSYTIEKLKNTAFSSNKESFGLVGTMERIRLYYGTQAQIQIQSTKQTGTLIHLSIPLSLMKEEHYASETVN